MLRALRVLAAAALTTIAAAPFAVGCSSSMEPKECDKIRGEAFELLNKAQHCDSDADCRQSEWPGCAKPLSNKTFDTLKPMKDSFTKGKCEEPKIECKEPPTVYCKQGLCVHREKGIPEGQAPAGAPGDTPVDQIQVK
ncbi:MAG TPA: hypothetical protein VGM56_00850 [Byssovorax sp.]|jgi:hypothetical protein